LQQLYAESEFRRTHKNLETRYLLYNDFADCPVQASLGLLGKKWTILILRDIGMYGRDRFHLLMKSLPSIPQKMLATRLKQLEQEGFIKKRVEKTNPPKIIRWSLTEKGLDSIRIGMMVGIFGAKWHADRVFPDKRPRKIQEIYDQEGLELLTRDFS
jgi:DNA-binding HxlR family transcriptional regulator